MMFLVPVLTKAVQGTEPLSACQELFALSPGAENAAIACGAGFGGLQRVCHDITQHQTSMHGQHAGCTLSLASTVWALRSFHSSPSVILGLESLCVLFLAIAWDQKGHQ